MPKASPNHAQHHLRPATASDVPALAALYRESVLKLGPQAYGEDQVAAWASFADEGNAFARFVLEPLTLIAMSPYGCIMGFGGIDNRGHLTSIYVHWRHCRQGIGSQLIEALLNHARTQGLHYITTDASALSRPLFERHCFQLKEVELAARNGVKIERYRMAAELP